ncbi:hypothetical protein [Sphingomonas sp.]|uniref:hypothetical protein n=1 Tax=Sphingomonas sp. TaxID=28214 RepID=UPI002FC6685E
MNHEPAAVDPALVARIEASFGKQAFMTTLGARLVRIDGDRFMLHRLSLIPLPW